MYFKKLDQYKYSGSVILGCNDNLKNVTAQVPNQPGVYIFFEINGQDENLKYIGASGSVLQNGSFKRQMMQDRINNKMNSKLTRANFFKNHFEKSKCDFIRIDWYVTFDKKNRDLPKYVEAKLIQEYFTHFDKLPEWNNSF